MSDWHLPENLYVGCPVVVSNDPSRSDLAFGHVTRVKHSTCDILAVYENGLMPKRSCYFHADPRIPMMPLDTFEDGTCGVFDFTEQEKQRQELMDRIAGLEDLLSKVSRDFGQLEKRVPKLGPVGKADARKKGGRPKGAKNRPKSDDAPFDMDDVPFDVNETLETVEV